MDKNQKNARHSAAHGAVRGAGRRRPGTLETLLSGRRGRAAVAGGAAVLCAVIGLSVWLLAGCHPAAAASGASSSSAAASAGSESYAEVAADSSYDAQAVVIDSTVYSGTVLEKTDDAGQDYVDGTLFIGDSNFYRFMNYGFTTLANDIGVVSMGAGSIKTLPCVKFKGTSSYITIPAAVKIMQPQRIVFGFGTNNLSGDKATFIKEYTKGIQAVYDAYPYCDIIVNAIPPVDKERSYTNVTMQEIDSFNEALAQMCEDNGWKFLNSSEALKDSKTGFAKTNYMISDGLHLSKEGCTALFEYIRTHSYETTDRRPKPLSKIPARAETPPDLITSDPLKTSGSASTKVDVTFTATAGGTITGTTEQTVKMGASCSAVTAVPNAGYEFAGWSCTLGRIENTAELTLTFTVPQSDNACGGIFVTANFKAVAPVVTFALDNTAAGTLSASSVKAVSGTASTTLTLAEGYALLSVTGGTAVKQEDGTYLITAEGVTANAAVTLYMGLKATPTPTATAAATPGPTATPAPTAEPTAVPAPTPTPTPVAPASSVQEAPSPSPTAESSSPAG